MASDFSRGLRVFRNPHVPCNTVEAQASILKSNVKGIPALFGLNPVSNFTGLL